MQPTIINKQEIKIIGIEVRTKNADEMSGEGKIGLQWQKFYQNAIDEKIPNSISKDEVLAIYTKYESDVYGEYSFILGKQVSSFDNVPLDMTTFIVPAAKYAKFTSAVGSMPGIVIDVWKHIWGLKKDDVGGNRSYQADFEVYDSRSKDPRNSQVDVCLSIK